MSFASLVHVPVFALLTEYSRQHPELAQKLEIDRERLKSHKDYAAAWDVVEALGSERVCLDLSADMKLIEALP